MEVWLLGLNRTPAEVMGTSGRVSTFIEIAQEFFRQVIFLQTDKRKGDTDQ